jgi:hypothetical protein
MFPYRLALGFAALRRVRSAVPLSCRPSGASTGKAPDLRLRCGHCGGRDKRRSSQRLHADDREAAAEFMHGRDVKAAVV